MVWRVKRTTKRTRRPEQLVGGLKRPADFAQERNAEFALRLELEMLGAIDKLLVALVFAGATGPRKLFKRRRRQGRS
jgi:hypothetical protein